MTIDDKKILENKIVDIRSELEQYKEQTKEGRKVAILGAAVAGATGIAAISLFGSGVLAATAISEVLFSTFILAGIGAGIFGYRKMKQAQKNHNNIFDKLSTLIIKENNITSTRSKEIFVTKSPRVKKVQPVVKLENEEAKGDEVLL
jgi:hypothetical protein